MEETPEDRKPMVRLTSILKNRHRCTVVAVVCLNKYFYVYVNQNS